MSDQIKTGIREVWGMTPEGTDFLTDQVNHSEEGTGTNQQARREGNEGVGGRKGRGKIVQTTRQNQIGG